MNKFTRHRALKCTECGWHISPGFNAYTPPDKFQKQVDEMKKHLRSKHYITKKFHRFIEMPFVEMIYPIDDRKHGGA